jgi:hypothetical protein
MTLHRILHIMNKKSSFSLTMCRASSVSVHITLIQWKLGSTWLLLSSVRFCARFRKTGVQWLFGHPDGMYNSMAAFWLFALGYQKPSLCMTLQTSHSLWFMQLLVLQYVSTLSALKKNSMAWVREQTMPTDQPPHVGEVLPTFADRGCHVVSVTDPYGRILGFRDRSHYFSIK